MKTITIEKDKEYCPEMGWLYEDEKNYQLVDDKYDIEIGYSVDKKQIPIARGGRADNVKDIIPVIIIHSASLPEKQFTIDLQLSNNYSLLQKAVHDYIKNNDE